MIGNLSHSALTQQPCLRSRTTTRAQPIRAASRSCPVPSDDAKHALSKHALLNTTCMQAIRTSHLQSQHCRFFSSTSLAASGDSSADQFREDLAESQSEKISDLADVDRTVELLMWVGSSIRWPWQVRCIRGLVKLLLPYCILVWVCSLYLWEKGVFQDFSVVPDCIKVGPFVLHISHPPVR